MKAKIKVRFNLGKGENYMKFKVVNPEHYKIEPYFIDPDEHFLLMRGARLVNQCATARKIFEGANKEVCAWIECDEVWVLDRPFHKETKSTNIASFNPKEAPHWRIMRSNGHVLLDNADDNSYAELTTKGRKVLIMP